MPFFRNIGQTVAAMIAVSFLAAGSTNAAQDDLIAASWSGDLPRVKALLEAKADVNAKGMHGFTALMTASQQDHLDVVRVLLGTKAEVDAAADNGATALMIASHNGYVNDVVQAFVADVVQALLDAKADVNARDHFGQSALWHAAQQGHSDIVRVLLTAKADVNSKKSDGSTALMVASQNGYLEVARSLLAANADVNARMKSMFFNTDLGNGETALDLAIAHHQLQIAQLLSAFSVRSEGDLRSSEMSCPYIRFEHEATNSILVTSGFPYQRGGTVTTLGSVPVHAEGEKIVESNLNDPNYMLVADAIDAGVIGIKWQFETPGEQFRRGYCVYTTLGPSSTVEFTPKGILVTGFKISE